MLSRKACVLTGPHGAVVLEGMKPRKLVRVKTFNRRQRHRFQHLCTEYGITVERLEEFGHLTWFEVVGHEGSLTVLLRDECVVETRDTVAIRTPHLSAGSGSGKEGRPFIPAYKKSLNSNNVTGVSRFGSIAPVKPGRVNNEVGKGQATVYERDEEGYIL